MYRLVGAHLSTSCPLSIFSQPCPAKRRWQARTRLLSPSAADWVRNHLYLLDKSLKTVMACPAPSLWTGPAPIPPLPSLLPALRAPVNVSEVHIRRSSQMINLKDTHGEPAGSHSSATPWASVVLTPRAFRAMEQAQGVG